MRQNLVPNLWQNLVPILWQNPEFPSSQNLSADYVILIFLVPNSVAALSVNYVISADSMAETSTDSVAESISPQVPEFECRIMWFDH